MEKPSRLMVSLLSDKELFFVLSRRRRAPSTASRSPSPVSTGEALRLRHISFPRRNGGSGERSEPIGALVEHTLKNYTHQQHNRQVLRLARAGIS